MLSVVPAPTPPPREGARAVGLVAGSGTLATCRCRPKRTGFSQSIFPRRQRRRHTRRVPNRPHDPAPERSAGRRADFSPDPIRRGGCYGAVQEFQPTDHEGRPIGEPTRRHSSWLDLQHHASQPASATIIDEIDLELPFGTESSWRYTVSTDDGSVIFWFAKGRAGMPVQVEKREGGELVSRSVMIGEVSWPSRAPRPRVNLLHPRSAVRAYAYGRAQLAPWSRSRPWQPHMSWPRCQH